MGTNIPVGYPYKCKLIDIGQFNQQGKHHGKGKYFFRNGDTYEGEWQNGIQPLMCLNFAGFFHGQGIFNRSNGDYYTGQFKKDVFHGKGVYVYRDGDKYEVLN